MINEYNFEKLNLDTIYEEFNANIQKNLRISEDPVEFLKKYPQKFLNGLVNKNLRLEKFDRDTLIKFFYIVCNKLKEIERETKLLGLDIMSYLIDYIPEPYFMNAFVFEKEIIQKVSQQTSNGKKKFVSVGDYELAKFDTNMGINYGFFASVLEDELKEIKINTLKIIGVIGSKQINQEFAMKSFRYIIELVNDEEDEVRYETIKTLEELITNFKRIEIESLEIIFFNMKEKSPRLRTLIYSMIGKIHCQLEKDFKIIIENILNNLKLFREDKLLIFHAIKDFSKNNCEFINIEYINSIFDIDPKFLLTEYNWNDIIYNATLIILQEFLKFNHFRIDLTLPKFFLKHFNYLSDKYHSIFEKEFYRSLLHIYTNNFDDKIVKIDKSQGNSESVLNNFTFEFEDNFEKIKNFFHVNDNYEERQNKTFEEIYKNILSFLKIYLSRENLSYSMILIVINGIINSIELINFKIILENWENHLSIVDFNIIISKFFLLKFKTIFNEENDFYHDFEKILNSKEFSRLRSSNNFNEFTNYLQSEINKKSQDNQMEIETDIVDLCRSIMLSLYIKFYSFLKETFLNISITNPKKNFNYVHTKDKMNYPFFLKLAIKIKSARYTQILNNSTYLIKILNISLIKKNQAKNIDFDVSCINYLDEEKNLSIKTKIPVYLLKSDEGEHKISVSIKSILKQELIELLQRLEINSITNEYIQLNKHINFIITY